MIRTHGLTHLALGVRDVERAFRFYHDLFGMEAVSREAGFIQAQTPGAWDVVVFQEDAARAEGSGGIAHFGFRLAELDGLERAAERIVAAGGSVLRTGEFCPGEPYVFLRDPDGYEVEIWYERATPLDPAAPAPHGRS